MRASFRLRSLLPGSSAHDGYAYVMGAWLIVFWSLVVRARISLGEWPCAQHFDPLTRFPMPSTLDPKAFPMHDLAVWAGLLVLVMLLPLEILIAITSVFVPSLRPSGRLTIALLGLTALVGVTLFVDPGGFFVWFLD